MDELKLQTPAKCEIYRFSLIYNHHHCHFLFIVSILAGECIVKRDLRRIRRKGYRRYMNPVQPAEQLQTTNNCKNCFIFSSYHVHECSSNDLLDYLCAKESVLCYEKRI